MYSFQVVLRSLKCLDDGITIVWTMCVFRADKNASDARIDLAACELMDALIDSADEYIGTYCPKKSTCVIS
jgi:hypothetical protein